MAVTAAVATTDPTMVLMAGPLGLAGGVMVCGGLPDPWTCAALLQEARDARRDAVRHDGGEAGRGPDRCRTPSRSLASGPGGPFQDAYYAAPWLSAFVSEEVGAPVSPSGTRGSYSYYERPGDHLSLHVDVHGCDVTLISVLHDDSAPHDPGGAVLVHRSCVGTPLDEIEARPGVPGELVRAVPGQSILILGGLVPHRVLPRHGPGTRIVAPLCFTAHLP